MRVRNGSDTKVDNLTMTHEDTMFLEMDSVDFKHTSPFKGRFFSNPLINSDPRSKSLT